MRRKRGVNETDRSECLSALATLALNSIFPFYLIIRACQLQITGDMLRGAGGKLFFN